MKNETGNQYGHLKVLAQAEQREKSNRCLRWICKCSCGKTAVINGNNLRMGRSQSCGQCDGRKGKRQ